MAKSNMKTWQQYKDLIWSVEQKIVDSFTYAYDDGFNYFDGVGISIMVDLNFSEFDDKYDPPMTAGVEVQQEIVAQFAKVGLDVEIEMAWGWDRSETDDDPAVANLATYWFEISWSSDQARKQFPNITVSPSEINETVFVKGKSVTVPFPIQAK